MKPIPNEPKKDAVVFVHGWRMSPTGAGNFAETMFKRLWHRGFKGRFVGFHWDTWWHDSAQWIPYAGGAIDSYLAHYNDSEYTAWRSGTALKDFVNNLPFQNKNVVAHSMGNIVIGAALLEGMSVKNYALLQAAVPAACYDEDEGRIRQTTQYNHLTFTMWDSDSPDADIDPATRNLAYRGTLKNVAGNLINFYLTRDYATSFAWEVNNDQTKPPDEDAPLDTNFDYVPSNAAGLKLLKFNFITGLTEYYITYKPEAMAYACRTWGKAVGAWGATEGSINQGASIDLSSATYNLPGEDSGFGDEHSGEFNANVQVLRPFYNDLMNALELNTIR